MKYNELGTGLKLELRLLGNDGKRIERPFASELEWAEENNILHIAAPIYEGRLYPVHVGTEIAVSFTKENSFYEFTAKVIARDRGLARTSTPPGCCFTPEPPFGPIARRGNRRSTGAH